MFAVVLLALLISVPVRAELRDPNNSADYIILTNQEVLSNNAWIDCLLDYRTAQGRVSMAVTVEEIWAEFTPTGSDSAIREFLHYAYDNWQTPRLKDVFIVGHWDVVPSGSLFSDLDSVFVYSDYLYTIPLDSDVYSPRFAVGRLPWSPRYGTAISNFAEKIRTYENSEIGIWSNRCHFIADSNLGDVDFESNIEHIFSPNLPGEANVERDYLGRAPGDPWHGDRNEVLQNFDRGALFTCYYGRGDSYEILPRGPITSENMAQLINLNQLMILCGTIRYGLGVDSIDREPLCFSALNSQSGGAIAAITHSRIGWGISGGRYNLMFLQELFRATNRTIGDCWVECRTAYIDSFVTVPYPYRWDTIWDTLVGTFLLGDPATIIPGRFTSADPITAPIIPTSIQIVGSYPNPFNPSTTISFMLNRAGSARLAVYDITGRAVTTLAEQSFTAGQHSIVWNAQGQASGMYLVRLESAGQFSTHRVTLLK